VPVVRPSPCLFLFALLIAAAPASAANRTVCKSGCSYTSVQAAIDAAQPGDTILLRAGETFVGNIKLRKKSGTSQITIRSDAPDSSLPPAGVRLVPGGRTGANTSLSNLAKLRGNGGTYRSMPVVRTDPGAANYRLMFLDIDGAAQEGYETLVELGDNRTQTSASAAPYNLVFDRVYFHGDPRRGQKRCLALNSGKTDVLNSYFADCKHFASDAQAIAGFNGPGPVRIVNNYLEATGENILFGGADPKTKYLVPSDITIERNHIDKPLSWRNPILSAPASPGASASSTSGVLGARTHYFKIVALLDSGGGVAVSAPSREVSVTLSGSSTSARLSWAAVSGATRYRIYRGTSAGGESVYLQTSGTSTSFTYTGRSESSGKPRSSGTLWNVKNLIELKNAQRVTISGNVIEHVWAASQNGYALVFTPRNQGNTAPWSVVQDITVTNNIIRHSNSGINILGRDYSASTGSQQAKRITIRNNVFDDINAPAWGSTGGRFMVITQGPSTVVVDHNTIFHTDHVVLVSSGTSSGFVFTNNLAKHNRNGIFGSGSSSGTATLNTYFPGWTFRRNVLAGGNASSYPSDNFFPSVTDFLAQFVNYSGGDFRLASSSPYLLKGTDGKNIGADIGAITAALGGGTAAEPSTNAAPTASAGGPYSGQVQASITVNGSGSRDSDGTIASYRWEWGDGTAAGSGATASHAYASAGTYTIALTVTDNDGATARATTTATIASSTTTTPGTADIVLTSRDVTVVRGRWAKKADSSAAGGELMQNTDAGWWSTDSALASPKDYFEAVFRPAPQTNYRVWLRLRASSRANDSVWVQFTGGTDRNGAPLWRTGTTNALAVVLENCSGCGVQGWGWQEKAYWVSSVPLVRFEGSGPQTIRVQAREDGVQIDQIVLSPVKYVVTAPGTHTNDVTKLPRTGATLQAGEIALRYDDVVRRSGHWSIASDSTAAGGKRLTSPNNGWAIPNAAYVSPSNSFDVQFTALRGIRYRVWLRLSAANGSGSNDSVWLQYSNALDAAGSPLAPLGTTKGVALDGEACSGCGLSGWGWKDRAYWTNTTGIVSFTTTGTQTLRVQTREDGVRIDQIVISPEKYLSSAPGASQGVRTWIKRDGTRQTY
jgi:PKD repeat protein